MKIEPMSSRRSMTPKAKSNAVAIKVTRRRFASAALHEAGIHHSLEQAGSDGHDHITHLVESFSHEGHVCLAFELHGRDLRLSIKRGKMPVAEVRSVTRQLLMGLAAMHAAGVIHTDVKPDNILYDRARGIARLSDLGLSETALTDGEPISTQDYAPPEAIIGAPMATPVDLWALGCTVYEMLTGELLFDPWKVCQAKYHEFGDDEPEDSLSTEADDDDSESAGPSRAELDEAEEKREQLAAGTIIGGKYRLVSRLGSGKFATVWKAVPIHSQPLVLGARHEVLAEARALRAALPELPPRARWDLYEVALAYEHLIQVHEMLNPSAEQIQGCWHDLFYESDTSLRYDPLIVPRPLISRLEAHLPGTESHDAATFLQALLRYDPRQRVSAAEALKMDWVSESKARGSPTLRCRSCC